MLVLQFFFFMDLCNTLKCLKPQNSLWLDLINHTEQDSGSIFSLGKMNGKNSVEIPLMDFLMVINKFSNYVILENSPVIYGASKVLRKALIFLLPL